MYIQILLTRILFLFFYPKYIQYLQLILSKYAFFRAINNLLIKLSYKIHAIHLLLLTYTGIIIYPVLFYLLIPVANLNIYQVLIAFFTSVYLFEPTSKLHILLFFYRSKLPAQYLEYAICEKSVITGIFIMTMYFILKAYLVAILQSYRTFKQSTYLETLKSIFLSVAIFIYRTCLIELFALVRILIRVYKWRKSIHSMQIDKISEEVIANKQSKPITLNKPNHDNHSILPPLSLLDTPKHKHIKWDYAQRLELLDKVLKDYNIKGKILSYNIGPVVTLYKLEPEPGVKASTIIGLSADIARSMSALSVRIATIPGHNLLGIEIANPARQTVFLRELLETDEYQNAKGIALALGCDIAGKSFIVNLETMPHMLIAGTTGSGKSVCIHTLLLSILYKHTPETCKLIMIDPKMLELSIYKDLPHLLLPVITNPKLAITALKWAITEMERRYENMSMVQARNISEYNANTARGEDKLPYIVVIVDEFADLMMVAGKEIDDAIQRLAQMARAAGIHVILATQRPSVDVITGTIKANFPTRLSFQLASRIDSRTILGDRGGADQLLGKGDMLYLNLSNLIRAHGPYVSNDEVEAVVKHWKKQAKPQYQELKQTDDVLEESVVDDDMFAKVMDYVYRTQKATASSVQREFSIGFNRAAKYLDTMEKMGKISAPDSMGRRKLL